MTRILFFGNSHASALMSAYRASPSQWSDWSAEFVICPGRNSPNVRVSKTRIRHRGSQVRSTVGFDADGMIEVSDYDVLVVSAVGLPGARNEHIASGRHPLGKAWDLGWKDLRAVEGERSSTPLVSTGLMSALLAEELGSTGGFQFVRDISRRFKGAIVVQPIPRPAESVLTDERWLLREAFGASTREVFDEHSAKVAATLSNAISALKRPNVALLPPTPAVPAGGFMSDSWARGVDPWHANAAHGASVLEQIRALLPAK